MHMDLPKVSIID